jgi:hypothetical protein
MNALSLSDTPHAVGALSVISKYHVLSNRNDSAGSWALLYVDARGMNLIEEREPARLQKRTSQPMQKSGRSTYRANLLKIGMPH